MQIGGGHYSKKPGKERASFLPLAKRLTVGGPEAGASALQATCIEFVEKNVRRLCPKGNYVGKGPMLSSRD